MIESQNVLHPRQAGLWCFWVAVALMGCGGSIIELGSNAESLVFVGSDIYQERCVDDSCLRARVDASGDLEIWLNDQQLTEDPYLHYDPALSPAGHYAYATQKYVIHEASISLNGETIAATDETEILADRATFAENGLYWRQHHRSKAEDQLCRLTVLPEVAESPSCKTLDFIPESLAAVDGVMLAVGFDPIALRYVTAAFDAELNEVAREESVKSRHLEWTTAGPRVFEVDGTAKAKRIFFSYRALLREQPGEAFTYGGNAMGRLTWNESYRLEAMAELAALTADPMLRQRIRFVVQQLLEQVDSEGRFVSLKYSIDQVSEVRLMVDAAMIHQAMLASLPYLERAQRTQVIAIAEVMFQSYEENWFENHYRFASCTPFRFDGIPVPYNQQNMMGMVAIQLYRLTGESKYLERVRVLFESFVDDFDDVDGVPMWQYRTALFRAGWEMGDYASCHAPSRPSSEDHRYEDTSHARLNLRFLGEAAELLQVPFPADIAGILHRIQSHDDGRFSLFLGGDVSQYAASYRNLPCFAWIAENTSWYDGFVGMPRVDFDRQHLSLCHAVAAGLDPSESWELQVRRFSWGSNRLQKEADIVADQTRGWTSIRNALDDAINWGP